MHIVNKYVLPNGNIMAMSCVQYAPCTLLMLEKDRTDRRKTDALQLPLHAVSVIICDVTQ